MNAFERPKFNLLWKQSLPVVSLLAHSERYIVAHPVFMLRLKLYYHFKPLLPWQIRMRVRRLFARRKLNRYKEIWPIDKSTSAIPSAWPGWPNKHKFAFVLSHDVESKKGLDKIWDMVDLETRLGFRSVINFIPEGNYRVDKSLIKKLRQRGFEVGVHGLYHDGKLYNSQSSFRLRAQKINHYIKEWEALGFRSPLMHHNLNWIHALNIHYDSSTFDTDPFEPQPDAAKTVFPFWVQDPNPKNRFKTDCDSSNPAAEHRRKIVEGINGLSEGRFNDFQGYVEIPYTLPQDSTLFLLLQEKTIDIWRRKLAWIAQTGGVALVNVHPDYMSFSDRSPKSTYPAALYEEFLQHAKSKYADDYWHTTPSQLADYLYSSWHPKSESILQEN